MVNGSNYFLITINMYDSERGRAPVYSDTITIPNLHNLNLKGYNVFGEEFKDKISKFIEEELDSYVKDIEYMRHKLKAL